MIFTGRSSDRIFILVGETEFYWSWGPILLVVGTDFTGREDRLYWSQRPTLLVAKTDFTGRKDRLYSSKWLVYVTGFAGPLGLN